MATYALIGGKSAENRSNFNLEQKIFSKLGLSPKRILFIPQASLDISHTVESFLSIVPKTYEVKVLMNLEDAMEAFEAADVIYFAGGSAKHLVDVIQNEKVDELLKGYKDSSKLFMGISAGAMLFTKWGCGDQFIYKSGNHTYNYQMVEGLGILPITLCPHYDHDGMECFHDYVCQYPYDGYALEDDTAVVFAVAIYPLKLTKWKSIYLFEYKKNYLMLPLYEEKL